MWNPLAIFSAIAKPIGNYFNEKQRQKGVLAEHKNTIDVLGRQAEIEVARGNANAKIEFAKTGQMQDYDLDKIAMQNMEKSFKDELLLLVFIAPMLMAFIPSMQELALKGFQIIEQMPNWYVYIIVGMVVVIYGMRGLLKWALNSKAKIIK